MRWKKEGWKLDGAEDGLGEWEAPRSLDEHAKLYALKLEVYFYAIKTRKGGSGNQSQDKIKTKYILSLMKSTFINEKMSFNTVIKDEPRIETLIHGWWDCKMVQPLWKCLVVSQIVKYEVTIWFRNSTTR